MSYKVNYFMKKYIIFASISFVLTILFVFGFVPMLNYVIAEINHPGMNSFLTYETALTLTIVFGSLAILSFIAMCVFLVLIIIKNIKKKKRD